MARTYVPASSTQTVVILDSITEYTPTAADAGKLLVISNATAVDIIIDTDLSLATGERIDFLQFDDGQLVFDLTLVGNTVADAEYNTRVLGSGASLVCVGSQDYWLVGDLVA
jgi:hypothetical protein